jgi:signal transduction histidine kinase
MKICSFDLECDGLELDFVPKSKNTKVRKLYKDGDIYSYFEVPTADEYLLKVTLPQKEYQKRVDNLKRKLFKEYIFYMFLIALLSFLFSLFSLRPLKKALDLNEEFVKDILHDINTPLSSMVLNFKLFKKEIGQNRKIERMEHSVNTILSLQNNLKSFLDQSVLQKDNFLLNEIIDKRVEYFKSIFASINFELDIKKISLHTNQEAFIRILDNLINNGCKYNSKNGNVKIYLKKEILYIEDNGCGIKDVKKVYDRYYTEHERGLGIGMHIVKKLCMELGIDIFIESKVNIGTKIALNLSKVINK